MNQTRNNTKGLQPKKCTRCYGMFYVYDMPEKVVAIACIRCGIVLTTLRIKYD